MAKPVNRISFDVPARTAYLAVRDGVIDRSVVKGNLRVDYDEDGNTVGVQVADFTKTVKLRALVNAVNDFDQSTANWLALFVKQLDQAKTNHSK